MSLLADNSQCLRSYLNALPKDMENLVEMFCDLMEYQGWDTNDVLHMLNSAKGISAEIDDVLDKFIDKQLMYGD